MHMFLIMPYMSEFCSWHNCMDRAQEMVTVLFLQMLSNCGGEHGITSIGRQGKYEVTLTADVITFLKTQILGSLLSGIK